MYNVMFVTNLKSRKIANYILKHHGLVKKVSNQHIIFELPNGRIYEVVQAIDGARAYKPHYAIIDLNIDSKIVKTVIMPCLTHCEEVEFI